MATTWRRKGESLESCNCEFVCPCILGPRNEHGGPMARPTEGHCDVPMAFRIDDDADGDSSWLDNVRHLGAVRLAAAKTARGSDRDHGFAWDNAGHNAHQAACEGSRP